MPLPRGLTMSPGRTVRCRVLRQRDNIQIYLPRAAVRYLGVEPGEEVEVQALDNNVVTVVRVPGSAPARPSIRAAAPAAAARPATPATPAAQPAPARPTVRDVAAVRAENTTDISEFRPVRRARIRR